MFLVILAVLLGAGLRREETADEKRPRSVESPERPSKEEPVTKHRSK